MRRQIPSSLSIGLPDPSQGTGDAEEIQSPSKLKAGEAAKTFRPMKHIFTRTIAAAILIVILASCLLIPKTVFRLQWIQQELENWRIRQLDGRLFCLQHINDGNWHKVSRCKSRPQPHCPRANLDAAYCGFIQYAELGDSSPITIEDETKHIEWNWGAQVREQCCFTGFGVEEAKEELARQGIRSITIIGDSSGRHVYASLLRLLSPQVPFSFEKHSNILYTAKSGLPLDALKFFWAPFLTNVTDIIEQFTESHQTEHDVVVSLLPLAACQRIQYGNRFLALACGTCCTFEAVRGKWNKPPELFMPEEATGSIVSDQIQGKRQDIVVGDEALHVHQSIRPMLLGEPELHCQKKIANRGEKTAYVRKSFGNLQRNRAPEWLASVPAPYQRGSHGFVLPTAFAQGYCSAVGQVSKLCGRHCTADGIHYTNSTYDVISQMVMNKLGI